MRHLAHIILLGFLLLPGCKPGGTLTRSLTYIDLLNEENLSFHQYPNELPTQLLAAVLSGEISPVDIDYLGSGTITNLSLPDFKQRIAEPYELYIQVPALDDDVDTLEHAWHEYFSNVSILSIDELFLEGERYRPLYLSFYHPEDIALEGFNKYICSIEFEDAISFLIDNPSHVIWHNYALARWGWLGGNVFKGSMEASSTLASDLIADIVDRSDSALLATGITLSLLEEVERDHGLLTFASYPDLESGVGKIFLRTRTKSQHLVTYDYDDLMRLASESYRLRPLEILPMSTALVKEKYQEENSNKVISREGVFEPPIKGKDDISKKPGRRENFEVPKFKSDQQFQFREVNRLFEPVSFPPDLAAVMYEGVRKGDIVVYADDTLVRRKQPGLFFDALIFEDANVRRTLNPSLLQVYLLIRDVRFSIDGDVAQEDLVGIGLIVPGGHVPERFNREAGFFKISDINALLKQNGRPPVDMNIQKGFPLKSWNIQVTGSELL